MSWRTLTYFGDSMLLIPTAVIIALVMPWKNDDRRAVWFWITTFCLTGIIVSLSKIAFMGFGIGSARFNFTGFSGHSAMSATLWPVMLWLLTGRLPLFWRGMAIGLGYMIPLLVGLSRLVLHAHSTSEVISGLLLGFTLSTAFLVSQRSARLKSFSVMQLCVALLVPLILLGHGRIAGTQDFLAQLSTKIAGVEKPWTRAEMLKQARQPHSVNGWR
ncbi:phosphatase PAP2 family protein [Erwiniaceae bacterium BAC15a-03b]|uniref:Phosphatase PAP2 family protein n=1 Tax=Winslowiella arboricola TaxID=2978220 RepID=A0A9J6PKH4_9GAMM|nr:phosphatase PAP2 family protein [Winslowiella arboricola]MCU5774262.1 phosphatase PAP2 family protein [Winslowiella arboricola]MCU5778809.1 phosphatase PAP2 family protein [Winslowiella arboricola]